MVGGYPPFFVKGKNMSHRITGSRTELARHCTYWARDDVPLPDRDVPKEASVGTLVHAMIDAQIKGIYADPDAYLATLSGTEEAREQASAIYWRCHEDITQVIRALELDRSEVKLYLVAGQSAGECLQPGARDYSDAPMGAIPGTVDACSTRRAIVVDWKTGGSYKGRASRSAQLAWGAVCLSYLFGSSGAEVAYVHLSEDGGSVDHSILTRTVLDDWERIFQLALESVQDSHPRPGAHCWQQYCPAAQVCPAAMSMTSAATEGLDSRDLFINPSDNMEADRLYAAVRLVESVTKPARERLRTYTQETGYKPHTRRR